MLAAMEAQGNHNQNPNQAGGHGQPDRDGSTSTSSATKVNPESEQFFSTGRTGRRNALPDILGDHAHVTSSDLPARLQALTTTGISFTKKILIIFDNKYEFIRYVIIRA